ncbi:zincin [Neocallimastix californiae]|uniref:Zincin n=1 Tax=Neocallimastix californiae TaxID=1754190 RepID=A0A1Y2FVU9_9FUNG|nr:zincin [Neocallimastix californiae]|eukprot:ORY87316.1 zincin [Neocallimastix californiae]
MVKQHMPIALTKYYVDHKLSENIKNKTKQIIENIKESMFDRISMIEWLDEETKQKVIEKLSKMKDIIEYPEIFNNPKIIYEKYKYIDIKDYFTYYLLPKNDNQFIYLSETESGVDPLMVNAFYIHSLNEIYIPAAYLRLPYYGISGSDYLNYGYFGTIIGHEVTHAFDNTGRLYDSDGNKNNWWTDDDDKDFKELSQCFIDQYNDFSFTVNNKKYVIDGEFTLGENIADNGGLSRGYEAWKKSILKNPEKASQHNKKLPGLSKYTLDQLFYIAYGQSHCSIGDEKDPHAPGKARVNVVLSNSKDFAKAFNCPTGSPMNPKNKCSMW